MPNRKDISKKRGSQVKACPIPPPKKMRAKIKDILYIRDLELGALFYFWLLASILVAKEVIIAPLFIAQTIIPAARYGEDQIIKVMSATDNPFHYKLKDLLINFTLAGRPEGYRVKARIYFIFNGSSQNAEGFYRINITAFCNGEKIYTVVRDEEIVQNSTGGTHGTIEINVDEGEGYGTLLEGNNTLLLSVSITSMLRHYGKGCFNIRIGPVTLDIESMDADNDGIIDPADNFKGNNCLLFFALSILPFSTVLIVKKLLSKKISQ